jgi:lipooligosaccharide transport system permease protein
VLEHNLMVYRRTWRGSVFMSFISPVFFLTAMGLGLGTLVRQGVGTVEGVSYRDFLAPGLLAATAMQTASFEMTYPIMSKVYWQHTYEGILATPLRVGDLVAGEIAWIVVRLLMVTSIFFLVIELFGANRSAAGPLAIVVAMLTGLAFATPIMAFSATRKGDNGFSVLQRFIVTPLFLFGGAFFPVSRLPGVLQVVAQFTPLYHGVALARGLTLGRATFLSALLHVLVLLVYAVAGAMAAVIAMRRRLIK